MVACDVMRQIFRCMMVYVLVANAHRWSCQCKNQHDTFGYVSDVLKSWQLDRIGTFTCLSNLQPFHDLLHWSMGPNNFTKKYSFTSKYIPCFKQKLGGGNSNISLCSPRKLGKIPNLTHIFQMGWRKPPTRKNWVPLRVHWTTQASRQSLGSSHGSQGHGRCEIWVQPIRASTQRSGFKCRLVDIAVVDKLVVY